MIQPKFGCFGTFLVVLHEQKSYVDLSEILC
jgi:hypothetical protein